MGFIKLPKSRPDVVNYIRKLTYITDNHPYEPIIDDLLSLIFPNFLWTISRLNCLKINASSSNWDKLNSSLTSAFLHLMHLPTINHIDLSSIHNFPLSSLTPSVSLLRLDISYQAEDKTITLPRTAMKPFSGHLDFIIIQNAYALYTVAPCWQSWVIHKTL